MSTWLLKIGPSRRARESEAATPATGRDCRLAGDRFAPSAAGGAASDERFRQLVYDLLTIVGAHGNGARASCAPACGVSGPQYSILMAIAQSAGPTRRRGRRASRRRCTCRARSSRPKPASSRRLGLLAQTAQSEGPARRPARAYAERRQAAIESSVRRSAPSTTSSSGRSTAPDSGAASHSCRIWSRARAGSSARLLGDGRQRVRWQDAQPSDLQANSAWHTRCDRAQRRAKMTLVKFHWCGTLERGDGGPTWSLISCAITAVPPIRRRFRDYYEAAHAADPAAFPRHPLADPASAGDSGTIRFRSSRADRFCSRR